MKVAYIIPALDNKGPVVFTQYLLSFLKEKLEYIEIFYFHDRTPIDFFGITCKKISFISKIDFSKFDIVHTTGALPDLYAALFIDKKKWVTSMHNYIEDDIGMAYGNVKAFIIVSIWKWAIKKCHYNIVSSNQMKLYYESFIGKNVYFEVIPYGIKEKEYKDILENDTKLFQKLRGTKKTIVGSVGFLIQRKGYLQLLPIIADNPDYVLVLIGTGTEKTRIESEAARLKISDRIFLLGFRDNSYNYYKYFDIYAHVSFSEGFGLAMLEAMSKSLPIICSRLPIYEDFMTDNDVSYFTPGNFESLKEAFRRVTNNITKYKKASYCLFKNKFCVEVEGIKHIKLYEKMIYGELKI